MSSLIKPQVVIDTNIFISGLLWGGNPKIIIDKWISDKILFVVSPFLAHEIVTTYAKFVHSPSSIEKLTTYLETKTTRFVPKKIVTICRDPKDNQILDLCLVAGADYLVTGDKDLLVLKRYKKTLIVTPKEFLKII